LRGTIEGWPLLRGTVSGVISLEGEI
jgi:hypothetical protein